MFPDAPQPEPAMPASLPPVPALPQMPSMAAASVPPPAAVPPADLQASVAERAKQLVVQYQHNPFQLSGALAQLKSEYLLQHYHIIPNAVEK